MITPEIRKFIFEHWLLCGFEYAIVEENNSIYLYRYYTDKTEKIKVCEVVYNFIDVYPLKLYTSCKQEYSQDRGSMHNSLV